MIVKQCEDSGCCAQKGYSCGAIRTNIETLVFIFNKPRKFFYLKVENHEECSCQRYNNHIK